MEANGEAVVTGASRGIGRAVALELARRGFGVVATMRAPAAGDALLDAARREGLRLCVEKLDVTQPGTFRFPEDLQVLVNNAGIETAYRAVEDATVDEWRAVFETNLFGLFEVTRRAVPLLRARRSGVICNVTTLSLLAPVPFYAAYRASKAAVSALGESLRAELAPYGVRVLEILPGPVETDMFATSDREYEAAASKPYRAMAEHARRQRQSAGATSVSAESAAHAIADAILDDGSPLRSGCDPMSVGMLDAWRQTGDEEWIRSLLPALTGVE